MYLLLRGHPERWGRRATADHDRLTNADSQGFKGRGKLSVSHRPAHPHANAGSLLPSPTRTNARISQIDGWSLVFGDQRPPNNDIDPQKQRCFMGRARRDYSYS